MFVILLVIDSRTHTHQSKHTSLAAIKSIDSVEIKMNEKIAIDRQQENMELNG